MENKSKSSQDWNLIKTSRDNKIKDITKIYKQSKVHYNLGCW